MTDLSAFDPDFAVPQSVAWKALDSPTKAVVSWQAVLLDRGGADGYWMRLLGQTQCTYRRVGALVITPESIAYSETVARAHRPRSAIGGLLRLARTSDSQFGDWTWTASAREITSVRVEPAVDSVHGPFAAVTIEARAERLRFGVDVAAPFVAYCLSAVRQLAAAALTVDGASGEPPRSDGLYVVAARANGYRISARYFEDSRVVLLRLNDIATFGRVRDGSWKVPFMPYEYVDGRLTIFDDDRTPRSRGVVDGGRLLLQHDGSRAENGFPAPISEMQFVSDTELASGWGSVRSPMTCPDWPPVLTSTGDLEAAPLGLGSSGDAAPPLADWARRLLGDAMDEAMRGADFRRIHTVPDGGEGSFVRPVGDDAATIRARGRRHAAGMGSRGRLAMITDETIDGRSCARCDAYDLATGESISLIQPYRKRLMAWRPDGELTSLGPAEPLS